MYLGLPDAVDARHGLQVHLRIPVAVHQDDRVRRLRVDSQPCQACRAVVCFVGGVVVVEEEVRVGVLCEKSKEQRVCVLIVASCSLLEGQGVPQIVAIQILFNHGIMKVKEIVFLIGNPKTKFTKYSQNQDQLHS